MGLGRFFDDPGSQGNSFMGHSFICMFLAPKASDMALALANPMTADEITMNLKALTTNLSYMLEKEGIVPEAQAKLASLGYTDVAVFSRMEDTAAAVREVLKADIGLDPATSPQHRAMVARVLVAWDNSKKRMETRMQEEANQRVSDQPRTLAKSLHYDLLKAYEKLHGEQQDKHYPAPAYIEMKLEQVESGELRAEGLMEVLNREEHIKPPPRLTVTANATSASVPEKN